MLRINWVEIFGQKKERCRSFDSLLRSLAQDDNVNKIIVCYQITVSVINTDSVLYLKIQNRCCVIMVTERFANDDTLPVIILTYHLATLNQPKTPLLFHQYSPPHKLDSNQTIHISLRILL